MIKKSLLFLVFLIQILSGVSQEQDVGAWYGLNLKYGITNRLNANFNTTVRTYNNASVIDILYLEAGLSYKVIKYISLAGYYRWIYANEFDNNFFSRHRWYADIKGEYKINRFEISARMRYQIQYKTYITEETDKIPDQYCRFKGQLYYNWPSFPVNPYIAYELFYPLNYNSANFADKKRFSIGVQYKIKKKHAIEAEYMFQRDYLPALADMNIISLAYNLSL
jgi:hypothetical protein